MTVFLYVQPWGEQTNVIYYLRETNQHILKSLCQVSQPILLVHIAQALIAASKCPPINLFEQGVVACLH